MCAKIHFATVTQKRLEYSGSVTIDKALLERTGMFPGEKVQLLNAANGARVETYVIEGEKDSGTICVNGPAAHLFEVGDKVVIISYALVDEEQAGKWKPTILLVDAKNRPLPG